MISNLIPKTKPHYFENDPILFYRPSRGIIPQNSYVNSYILLYCAEPSIVEIYSILDGSRPDIIKITTRRYQSTEFIHIEDLNTLCRIL